jgi:hypothetical protein
MKSNIAQNKRRGDVAQWNQERQPPKLQDVSSNLAITFSRARRAAAEAALAW